MTQSPDIILTVTINFGPLTIWLSALFVAFWMWLGASLVFRAWRTFQENREIERRQLSTLQMAHVAPAPEDVPSRVNPIDASLPSRWSRQREMEEA